MYETLFVDCDADMQFFVRQPHEDQVPRLKLAPGNRHAAGKLFVRGARHVNAGSGGRESHQTAAIEPAGRGATPAIRLIKHRHGALDHDPARIRGRRVRGRSGRYRGVVGFERITRTRGQSQAQACDRCRPN